MVDHSAYIYLIAPGGSMVDYFPHDSTADEIVAKIVPRISAAVSGQDKS